MPPIVTLAEAKTHLQIATTNHDAQLTGYLDAPTAGIEHRVGAVVARTVAETYDGAGLAEIVLRSGPVLSIVEVAENGQPLDPDEYHLNDSGLLLRVSGWGRGRWAAGAGNVAVSYLAGRDPVPAHLKLAACLIIGHLWSTQRNTSGGRPPLTSDETQLLPGFGFAIPNQAADLLASDMDVGV